MAVGLNPSKGEIDTIAGSIARDLQAAMNRAKTFKYFLDGKPDADLIALGYTAEDVALLRSAYTDIAQLYDIACGLGAGSATDVQNGKDFRTFIRRIFGMGAV